MHMLRVIIAMTMLLIVLPVRVTHAQQTSLSNDSQSQTVTQSSQVRYFPETGHTVGGRFLQYWQANGGLAVFGYPLTNEVHEQGRTVQYFERQRFEYHPEQPRPYDVLLGRLGAELLEQQGIDWREQPTSPGQAAGCTYFALTQHNLCNQRAGTGFLTYWTTHGLQFDTQVRPSYAESLALFGLPLTEPYNATNSSGDRVQVQWFERARFEWHPNNPQSYQVLLGRLGAELLEAQRRQPAPQPPTFRHVRLYLIAIDDQGRSGKQIGCNDSVVPVTMAIKPTTAPLTAALEQLLALDRPYFEQTGLYNALYRSNLTVDRVTVQGGQATIWLTGDVQLGGVCDNPRIDAQITETARQFSTVDEVVVFVNGQRLEDVLSGR